MGNSGLDSCPGEPIHKGAAVVIAAKIALAEGHPAKLGGPNDQGVLEQPAGFQILYQRGGGLVHGVVISPSSLRMSE